MISIIDKVMTAQIWRFQIAENNVKTSRDWKRLGGLIELAASSQLIMTAEIGDLCDKIKKGLKGLHILRHSALLTVREKFDIILALNLYILVHSKDFPAVIQSNPEKEGAINHLKTFMCRTDIDWCAAIPLWITSTKEHNTRSDTKGEEFVSWLRYIVEHEYLYIPPVKTTRQSLAEVQMFGLNPDLEAQVRALMEDMFLEAQNIASDLDIEY